MNDRAMHPLRRFRKANRLTATEMALKLDVSERSVLAYEQGAYKPSPATLARMASIMGLSVPELHLELNSWREDQRK